jgi:integrase
MSGQKITQKLISQFQGTRQENTIFIRDSTLQGFAIRVTKNGTVSFIAEGRIKNGKSKRITVGKHPLFSVQDAKAIATQHLQLMRKGVDPEEQATQEAQERQEQVALKQALEVNLGDILESFFQVRQLKPKTEKDYKNTISLYFHDWLSKPIRDINRQDIEKRFFSIKEAAGRKGTGEQGKATATKAMRILSSVFNYAKAEEVKGSAMNGIGTRLITENPVEVLREKKVDRSIRRRDSYLTSKQIVNLLNIFSECEHEDLSPGASRCSFYHAIALIIFTGLRREEAFSLKWEDVFLNEEVPYLKITDTKNNEIHYVPLTDSTKTILKLRQIFKINEYVFPAYKGKSGHISEPRKTLNYLAQQIGKQFTIHDLRRTFATKAQEIGLDVIALKRLLNHKRSSGDVTEGYVVMHSKEKLIIVRGYLEKIEKSIMSDEAKYTPTIEELLTPTI